MRGQNDLRPLPLPPCRLHWGFCDWVFDMSIIETKFSIGDTVYHASTTTERKQHPCPDCLGARQWDAKSPAGREYKFACPRCGGDYQSDSSLSLYYSIFVPIAYPLTIGMVRGQSGGPDAHNEYMCQETRIGSRSIYYEDSLFATEKEALEAAAIKADLENKKITWVVEQYQKSLRVCDYQLSDALVKSEKDQLAAVRVTLNYLVEDIRGASCIEDVQRKIDKFDKTADSV